MSEIETLICSCCGRGVLDDAEHNVSHGESPYPHDEGFGMCRDCGGDSKAKGLPERLGWAAKMFYDTRIKILEEKLSSENSKRFKSMPYRKKIAIVARMVEKGVMI